MNKVRTGKQNRHEKIAVVLLSGKPISPADIMDCFKGTDQEKVLYRLSTNIYNIYCLQKVVLVVFRDLI